MFNFFFFFIPLVHLEDASCAWKVRIIRLHAFNKEERERERESCSTQKPSILAAHLIPIVGKTIAYMQGIEETKRFERTKREQSHKLMRKTIKRLKFCKLILPAKKKKKKRKTKRNFKHLYSATTRLK